MISDSKVQALILTLILLLSLILASKAKAPPMRAISRSCCGEYFLRRSSSVYGRHQPYMVDMKEPHQHGARTVKALSIPRASFLVRMGQRLRVAFAVTSQRA